jgi:pyruvate/2-oxoglutarate dehydrogenase complex dihydrolipoamide acyltransferase (E2) component
MQYEVTLPSLGDDLEDMARVSMWLADEGDIVNENDDLVEMVTDKAAFTVPSPKSGTLIEKLVDEEDEVKVGDVICILEI